MGWYIFLLKEEPTTVLQAFAEKTRFFAMIDCSAIQLHPEAFWSAPVGDALWKAKMKRRGSSLITFCS